MRIPIFLFSVLFVSLYGCSIFAPEVSKAQTELKQKELTDFAQKQRELYRKTHNGY